MWIFAVESLAVFVFFFFFSNGKRFAFAAPKLKLKIIHPALVSELAIERAREPELFGVRPDTVVIESERDLLSLRRVRVHSIVQHNKHLANGHKTQ